MKVLIIRFSSFGDIVQGLGVPAAIHARFPKAEIHWLTRKDFEGVVALERTVSRVWTLDRRHGIAGLMAVIWELRRENFTHIYDAHNNLRSHIVSWLVRAQYFARRSKARWKRFLLFWLGRNLFPKPYLARESYLEPLKKWNLHLQEPPPLEIPERVLIKVQKHVRDLDQFVALVPATAWTMKNWPRTHWREFMAANPETDFVILGGSKDDACFELERDMKQRQRTGAILNLAGRLDLEESAAVVSLAKLTISADTGLLHMADILAKPAVALLGPTAFGRPSRSTSRVLEVDLPCRPCTKDGRGRCSQEVYQKCLVDITPTRLNEEVRKIFPTPSAGAHP